MIIGCSDHRGWVVWQVTLMVTWGKVQFRVSKSSYPPIVTTPLTEYTLGPDTGTEMADDFVRLNRDCFNEFLVNEVLKS